MLLVLASLVCSIVLDRIYVIYISAELGGIRSAQLIRDRILSIHRLRRVSPPTSSSMILRQLHLPEGLISAACREIEALIPHVGSGPLEGDSIL